MIAYQRAAGWVEPDPVAEGTAKSDDWEKGREEVGTVRYRNSVTPSIVRLQCPAAHKLCSILSIK